jgi:hypothetical protein
MRRTCVFALLVLCAFSAAATFAQTQKALTNADIVTMSGQGFDPALIIKTIQSSPTNFDISPQALIELKNAGVQQSVMEAMLSAQAIKPSASVEAAHGAMPAADTAVDSGKPACNLNSGCLLRDASVVNLKFAAAVSSKTAHEGDPVEFVLDEDIKVADTVVVAKGTHAVAQVSVAKHAGMMGKPGELSVQLQYLIAGSNHIHLRGTKGREGESKTGATVALTVLFGPIGLIKHGKDVEIPAGTPLSAYVDQDIWLPAIH